MYSRASIYLYHKRNEGALLFRCKCQIIIDVFSFQLNQDVSKKQPTEEYSECVVEGASIYSVGRAK